MLPNLLLPALVLLAPANGIPGAVQVHPRIWVLKTAPDAQTYAALKAGGITHVINLRRDGEKDFDPTEENQALSRIEIAYVRLAMGRVPAKDDLDLFRMILRDLPSNARVLVHCNNGNRAAAAACAFMVLEAGMPVEQALNVAREAGLAFPETEKALKDYLGRQKS